MPPIKEFKINEYLTLKLENNQTNIYVNDILFNQCKYLLFNIPIEKISDFDNINSIDEISEYYNQSLDRWREKDFSITPETEFLGHCSNLQVWYEYDYNTRLLHSSLSFPLLKRLTEVGDEKAERAFKQEIISRYINGNETVRQFLSYEGYINFLLKKAINGDFKSNEILIEALHMMIKNKEYKRFMEFIFIDNFREILFKSDILDFDFFDFLILAFPNTPYASDDINYLFEKFEKQFFKNRKEFLHFILKKRDAQAILELEKIIREKVVITIDISSIFEISACEIRGGEVVKLKINASGLGHFIYDFPFSITQLKSLEHLVVMDLKNKNIPKEITNLKKLKKLELYGNPKMISFPICIIEIETIKELVISGVAIRNYPKTFKNFTSLEKLEIKYSDYIFLPLKFPRQLTKLKNLKNLKLRSYLETRRYEDESFFLTNYFGNLNSLEILNLWDDRIRSLPESFGNLESLKNLSIVSNQLQQLPNSFGKLNNLRFLSIRSDNLESLPESFGNLKNLRTLKLKIKIFKNIPKSIGNLEKLETLEIESNKLEYIPESMGNLSSIKSITIKGFCQSVIPKSIGNLKSLEKLEMNYLKNIPKSIGGLCCLKLLKIHKSDLKSLPDSIGDLKKLELLSIQSNQSLYIPSTVEKLHSLDHLKLTLNNQRELPNSIWLLIKLKNLSIWSKSIKKLPPLIDHLTNLTYLKLETENLETIPNKMKNLRRLKRLYIHSKKIRRLPPIFSQLTSLEFLEIYRCPKLSYLPPNLDIHPSLKKIFVPRSFKIREDYETKLRISGIRLIHYG
ncbi:MAG: hypothetical protein GF317_07560 [Candidatus Lokiarchaeota archaeon]|nr:hypothetical protein [Candidatus Lokiarchaeota archaeon]MBD3199569.1 hypothetical protein [Candidatus Lokiarchaeota archaeon]